MTKTNYMIDSGEGNWLANGGQDLDRARKTAQRLANERGETVTVYESPMPDGEGYSEDVEPSMRTQINSIATKYGTRIERSPEDGAWATKHPLARDAARAMAAEINAAGGEASTAPDHDDRSREWVHVTVTE